MDIKIRQFSSLEKLFCGENLEGATIEKASILPGEHFSYQVAVSDIYGNIEDRCILKATLNSPLAEYVKIYSVKNVAVDFPHNHLADDNYIIHTPTQLPDVLVPLEEQKGYFNLVGQMAVLWVEVCLPRGFAAQKNSITLHIEGAKAGPLNDGTSVYEGDAVMELNVLDADLPEQKTMFTQWFHVDCIATAHNVSVYSEEHWSLIGKYMQMASNIGINMILTPVITPPLDTAPHTQRPNTQLVKITKNGESYSFDFSLLHRYIKLAKGYDIKYFEISHFFSQWGCRYSPNITATENGEEKLLFGWHVLASDPMYANFLKCFIPELLRALEEDGVLQNCYFHLSDEPSEAHLEHYKYARSILKPLLGDCKIMDALSNIEFYEKGLVEHPVCSTNHIEAFLEKNVAGLWAYYCCSEVNKVSNRFIAMPSYRNRILGLQLYKYGIEGFLQWGYNFYYSQDSLYEINPYITTSSDGIFTSGDPFSVYPAKGGPVPSLRAFVFREALEDIEICRLLEQKIGKEAVVKLIEDEAGMELTFKQYPKNAEFIKNVIGKMKAMIVG